ncbi:MAG: M20/M25/M40 family metallo-hydrolase, partial [Chloroflexota bacterium]
MNNPIDWKACTEETANNLACLIRANTTNPPGNELPAILYIKETLERDGFGEDSFKIVESAPNRVNLVARLKGDGSQRPLMLTGHVDVVPVEAEHWSHDPFGGEIIDGEVWGRGAMDMKGFLAMYLEIFLLARRRGLPLKRDIILAAIADEEAGFTHGSKFLVDQHPDLIDAEYALNEGGAMSLHFGNTRVYPIQVAEKGVCWLNMTTHGEPGHGSMPHGDNAVFHLARALDRLQRAGHLPLHMTPTFKSMLDGLSQQLEFPAGLLVKMIGIPWVANQLLKLIKGRNKSTLLAMMSNSISPTILKAGTKSNVIPSSAEAHIDCRILPGQTPDDAMREIKAITGPGVILEPVYTSTGAEFSTETPLYKLLVEATQEMDPKGLVVPMLIPGATDATEYKRAGIKVYGFTPMVTPKEFPLLSLAHGHD